MTRSNRTMSDKAIVPATLRRHLPIESNTFSRHPLSLSHPLRHIEFPREEGKGI